MTEFDALNKVEARLLAGGKPFELRPDAVAVIIGLGGTGCDFAAQTKRLLQKRYEPALLAGKIKFLCLDTDVTNMPKIFNEAEFIPVKGFDRNDWINGWLHESVSANMDRFGGGGNGAAGIRQCGRWQLFSTEPKIIAALKTIFADFSAEMGQKGIKKIYVIEMASVCGGTGCGAFIDIPYFVRKTLCALHIPEEVTEFYGMLELPDSKIEHTKGLSEPDKKSCRSNAYAALKELAYFMGNDVQYAAKFRDDPEMFVSTKRVFTQCFLLSNTAIDIAGRTKYNRNPLDKNANMTYLDGAIPEVINIMLSKPREETIGGEKTYFGFDPAMSNINGRGFFPDEETGKARIVSTIGVSKIEIPLPEIILGIFNRLFLGLSARWDAMKDRALLDSIINKILSIVGVRSLLEYMINILDFEGLTDEDIAEGDYLKSVQTRIEAFANRRDIQKKNEEFEKKIKDKIDELYKRYGPFLILKALEEEDGYGKYVNKQFDEIAAEHDPSGINILRQEINNYNNFDIGLFGWKKQEKEQKFEDLKEHIKIYFVRQSILPVLKELIDKRRRIIRDDFHNKYFDRVNKMIEELTRMLKRITGVETTARKEQTADATIFSWDFARVPYSSIHERIDYLFAKKITIKGNPNPLFRKGRLCRMEGGEKKEELFFLPEEEGKKGVTIRVEEEETLQNVTGIEEVLLLNGVETTTINMEDMIKNFLMDVKETKTADIFDVMLNNFGGIIDMFTKESFKDLLVMYSPGWDFNKSLVELDENAKKRLFRQAIEKFKTFALPSFPVVSDKINNQLATRHFSVTLEPDFEPEYKPLISEVRDQIIGAHDTQRIPRDKIAMMIAVNFYFDYSLSWYIELEDCRKEYDAIKDSPAGAGLHLAEGAAENWRGKLEEIC
ncbi:MAG: hypothetical protein LBD58_07345 [Treponema sp.]|jgi:hypothetical protein|nr:hypothetical protein [Treponema sp.]